MIPNLEILCYRAHDIPLHKKFYTMVMQDLKGSFVRKELRQGFKTRIHIGIGKSIRNPSCRMNWLFGVTRHVKAGKSIINVKFHEFLITDRDKYQEAIKIMTQEL